MMVTISYHASIFVVEDENFIARILCIRRTHYLSRRSGDRLYRHFPEVRKYRK